MENFSEKPKRGRPPLFCEFDRKVILPQIIGGEQLSERSKTNRLYRQNAINALCRHPKPKKIAWLWDKEKAMAGTGRKIPEVLFTELGRLGSDELIWAFAEQICKIKLPITEAARRVRALRLEKPPTA